MDCQKRKKNFFSATHGNQKKRKSYNLEPGMKGFFCTCNFHEKECVREAYNILNEFADNICDRKKDTVVATSQTDNECPATQESVVDVPNKEDDVNNDDDISVSLNKEVADLVAESQKPAREHRFQAMNTGVKSVVFIQTTIPDPLSLVSSIIKDLEDSKKPRTRFLMRLLPVQVVCKAYMNDITAKADALFERYFTSEPKTFSIVFNRHSNQSIQRNHVIEDLAEIIVKKNPGNKVDLKNPEMAVVVEVIRGVCLLSIAPHYYKYKKYNLLEICSTKEPDQQV